MAPIVFKPENALKRADELIHVNQSLTALQGLHDLIMSRRFRHVTVNVESIMLKYVELAVDLRKGKLAREALAQYRYHTSNAFQAASRAAPVMQDPSASGSLENVLMHFLQYSGQKLDSDLQTSFTSASASGVDSLLETIEDLEEYETPDSLLMKYVYGGDLQNEESKIGVPDRDSLLASLRFHWEVFRICLDLTKNNAKLELLSQKVANQAFQFCLKYRRKNEFRRLADLLRGYLSYIVKGSTGSHSHHGPSHHVNIYQTETTQLFIEVRFNLLNTAIALELWQEAFRSIEDLHGLFVIYKKGGIKGSLMINYYESLVKIFQMSQDMVLAATAWNKLVAFLWAAGPSERPDDVTLRKCCTSALLAAMSIPAYIADQRTKTGSGVADVSAVAAEDLAELDDADEPIAGQHGELPSSGSLSTPMSIRESKLIALLGLSDLPSRDELLKTAIHGSAFMQPDDRTYVDFIEPTALRLHDLLAQKDTQRTGFLDDVLASCAFIQKASSDYDHFLKSIKEGVAFQFLLQSVAVYCKDRIHEIPFDELMVRCPHLLGQSLDASTLWFEIEKFLLSQNAFFDMLPARTRVVIDHSHRMVRLFYLEDKRMKLTSSSSSAQAEGTDGTVPDDDNLVHALLEDCDFNEAAVQDLESISHTLQELMVAIRDPKGHLEDRIESILQLLNLRLDQERKFLLARLEEADRTRHEMESVQRQREAEEKVIKEALLKEQRSLNAIRRREELERRLKEKQLAEREIIEREDRRKLIEEVNKKLTAFKKPPLDVGIFLKLSKAEILREQARLLDEARKEIDKRFSSIGKRLDHKERAIRLLERPLIEAEKEKQREKDVKNAQAIAEQRRKKEEERLKELQNIKERALKMKADADAFLDSFRHRREDKFAAKRSQLKAQMDHEKVAYREQFIDEKYQNLLKEEKEDQLRKLDEISEKQRQKEAEIERKLAAEKVTPAQPAITTMPAAASSGRYVPKYKRG